MDILRISQHPELLPQAAAWFHGKWGIPFSAYEESMEEALRGTSPVPEWYLVREGEAIAGGCGVIENDFHDRPDLHPNVCAVFVEPERRGRGIAGQLLQVFLNFAEANHLAFLTLEVRPSNAAAIALYQCFGFQEAGRRKNYYDLPKEDALILTRRFDREAAQ